MLPGELGEIPTTDDAINCNNTTWIIKYLPKSRAIYTLLNNLVREEIFFITKVVSLEVAIFNE